jgi:hypothetical protein
VLGDRGKDADEIRHETIRIRQQLRAESSSLAG